MQSMLLCLLIVELLAFIPGAFVQSATSVPPSFKVGTTNVLVDVVVTGQHGVPIEGLSQENFTVFEDGHEQPIVSFEAHSSPAAKTSAAAPSMPAGVYTNAQVVSDTADVLLIDSLNTPTSSQALSHQALVAYLKTLPIDKPIAVFTLTTQLRLLEDFTTDHTVLLKAVEEFSRLPQKSPFLKTQQETAEQLKNEDDTIDFGMALKPEYRYLGRQQMRKLQQFYADTDSFNINLRVQYTLSAFDQLARYLSGMPGRKNVMWLSGSFPLVVTPDADLKNPFQAARDFSGAVEHTAGLLANARVAIYPIDARGLYPQTLSSASMSGGSVARDPERVRQAQSEEFTLNAEEQMSLEAVAHATGGKAIYNTNDLKSALREVDRDGAHYYSLAYRPSDKSQGDKLRRIEVRVRPGKYHLSYRRSYIPAEASWHPNGAHNFAMVMQHDVPACTQILFRLAPLRVVPPPVAASIAGSNPNVPRPVIRYSIRYDVDVASISLTESADGVLQGSATVLAIAYDRNGTALNSVSNTLKINVPNSEYAKFQKLGIQYQEQLDLPAQTAWLRAGVFDPSSGRVGSLELPFSVPLKQ